MNLPGISCYCATYGRPKKLIENCIQCFLDQDWAGQKELVILEILNTMAQKYHHLKFLHLISNFNRH
jgi:hypothetical protein